MESLMSIISENNLEIILGLIVALVLLVVINIVTQFRIIKRESSLFQ
ncbi:hypothetical protein [Caldisalinibacter kiritimatiensis]|nr:hypothetical protein [Caldisalinibacter kiritimatiensis]